MPQKRRRNVDPDQTAASGLTARSLRTLYIDVHVFHYRGKNNILFYDLVACGKMGPGIFVDGCPTTQVLNNIPTVFSLINTMGALQFFSLKMTYLGQNFGQK